jgi:hypothetical protein
VSRQGPRTRMETRALGSGKLKCCAVGAKLPMIDARDNQPTGWSETCFTLLTREFEVKSAHAGLVILIVAMVVLSAMARPHEHDFRLRPTGPMPAVNIP